jgi:ABC-type sugar transport system substrate-binding protein
MRKVALLLDQADNAYQQGLVQEARARARRRNIALLEPQFVDGSAMAQMAQIFVCGRGETKPDGVMVTLAGSQSQRPACERMVKVGVSLVFLNRIPDYLDDLRAAAGDALVAGVAPDQVEIGRLQAECCARLQVSGADGTVLLVTGTPKSATATRRLQGFQQAAQLQVQAEVVEGHWTEESGYRAVLGWLRLAMGRERQLGVVVCQNDLMARGARRALVKHATSHDQKELARVPIVGCDGLPAEGRQMVDDGELVATVVLPPTSGRAIDVLAGFWEYGSRADLVLLPPDAYPPLAQLKVG